MKFGPLFKESTSKTSLKFAWNLSSRLPASPYGKKDDVRSLQGSSFTEEFIYWDTGLRWKQSSFQIGCHFCRRPSRVAGMLEQTHGQT